MLQNQTNLSYVHLLDFSERLFFDELGLGLGLGLEQKGFGLGLETTGLGLGLGLGKICNQDHFQFSLCTFALVLSDV